MSSTIRVLIADDSPTMLKMYSALLSSAPDIQVVGTAKDGAEALELARTLHPDVITLDVRMPRMDGIEASSRIMAAAPSRILVISAAMDAEMSFKALQAGALEVMPKPRPNLEGLANFGVKLIHIIRTMAELPVSQRREHPVFVDFGVVTRVTQERNRQRRDTDLQHFIECFLEHVQTGNAEDAVDLAGGDQLEHDRRAFGDEDVVSHALADAVEVGDRTEPAVVAMKLNVVELCGAILGLLEAVRHQEKALLERNGGKLFAPIFIIKEHHRETDVSLVVT